MSINWNCASAKELKHVPNTNYSKIKVFSREFQVGSQI
jgi:hypothetical protein